MENFDSIEKIIEAYPEEWKVFKEGGEVGSTLETALCRFYQDDMPYGTLKARDGDPMDFIIAKLDKDYSVTISVDDLKKIKYVKDVRNLIKKKIKWKKIYLKKT